jgi:hypothetical protein
MMWGKRHGTHPGIELRIRNRNGELIRTDSDTLYYAVKYGNYGDEGWLELIPGCDESNVHLVDEYLADPTRIVVEVRSVKLPTGKKHSHRTRSRTTDV